MENLSTISEHIARLRQEMEAHEIPEKGVNMAKYLKNKFPCFGIKAPIRNKIQRKWFNEIKSENFNHWDVVYELWDLEHREYQYIAIDYLKRLPKKAFHKDDYKYFEELITSKSWWDSVDSIACNPVGVYFQQFPEMIDQIITEWRNSDNMWLNRTCLIFQMKYKDDVDFELLKDLIIQYQDVKEFFIQKAIGWSLRQYSKFNPDGVREFMKEIDLQGLAYREGSKYV